MTLEEKILAYLDGSLDEDSSADLLHSLSTSPEKRAMLEEHLRLRNMLALGQKPFAIPAAAERSLATRIPALAGRTEVATRLVRRSALSVLFAGASEWIGGVFTAPVARWGLGMASLAAIGVTAWMLGTSPNSNPATNSVARVESTQSPIETHSTSPASAATSLAAHPKSSATAPSSEGSVSPDRNSRVENLTSNGITSKPLEPTNDDGVNGGIAAVSAQSAQSTHNIAADATPILPKVALPVSASMPPGVTLTVGYAQYQYQLPGVGTTVSTTGSHPEIGINYELSRHFALRAEGGIASHPSFQTTAQMERVTSITGESYSRVVYGTSIATSDAAFSRLGLEYVVNPASSYEFHVAAAGGAQFASTLIPMAMVNVGVSHPINSLLAIDLSAIATGTWGQSLSSFVTDSMVSSHRGALGILHSEATIPSTVFAQAFGLRAGIRYQF